MEKLLFPTPNWIMQILYSKSSIAKLRVTAMTYIYWQIFLFWPRSLKTFAKFAMLLTGWTVHILTLLPTCLEKTFSKSAMPKLNFWQIANISKWQQKWFAEEILQCLQNGNSKQTISIFQHMTPQPTFGFFIDANNSYGGIMEKLPTFKKFC